MGTFKKYVILILRFIQQTLRDYDEIRVSGWMRAQRFKGMFFAGF